MTGPLLTTDQHAAMIEARQAGTSTVECSLDLGCSTEIVGIAPEAWVGRGQRWPYLAECRERTIYHWAGHGFEPVARYAGSLIKLVPTTWGPPTFEIDGIKMLPTAQLSPYADAERKVALIEPQGKTVLDTCGGLGYFAAACLKGQARRVLSFEKNADVLWLRTLNPWSPRPDPRLELVHADIVERIAGLSDGSVDAILHDPPRFGIAGELYSRTFYDQLARLLRRRGRLFHYTGTPNRLTSGRDVPAEVSRRLRQAGFRTELSGDGVLAVKR